MSNTNDLPETSDMPTSNDRVRVLARWVLGASLILAGTGHLTVQREEFQAQVPNWFPLDDDVVVVVKRLEPVD